MRAKREVLGHLKRDELLVAVDCYGLEVPDRRVREGLVEALVGSRRAGLAEILTAGAKFRLAPIGIGPEEDFRGCAGRTSDRRFKVRRNSNHL